MLVCIFFLIVFVHIAMDNFIINKHWFGFVRVICNRLNEFWFSTTKHASRATVGFPMGILHGASDFSFIPFFRFLSLLTHILCCQKLREHSCSALCRSLRPIKIHIPIFLNHFVWNLTMQKYIHCLIWSG